MKLNNFVFLNSVNKVEGDVIVKIPQNINTKDELLKVLSQELKFPEYFGMNWDALSDCLRDFHWLPFKRIVIEHEDLPSISDDILKMYLEILSEAVQSWKNDSAHKLVVVFSDRVKNKVASI